ncbi:MAG: hypothetical protein EPN84_07665 [Legionella sp.]|nr:MAG: hypothetical protein EPN84_07665 [Legionella sp.]
MFTVRLRDEESQLSLPPQPNRLSQALFASGLESSFLLLSAAAMTPFLSPTVPFCFHPLTIACAVGMINFLLRLPLWLNEPFHDSQSNWIRSVFFANFDAIYRSTLLHETAHALTALYFYPHSNPQIQLNPPYGGITSYEVFESSSHHKTRTINALISAAGPSADLLWGYCSLYLAQVMAKQKPQFSSHLRLSCWFSVVGNLCYALTALGGVNNKTNDFHSIYKNTGISPFFAAMFILSSMLIWQMILSKCHPNTDSQLGNNRFGLFNNSKNNTPEQSVAESKMELTYQGLV